MDIALELPHEIVAAFEQHAAKLGKIVEDLMREALENIVSCL